MKIQAPRGTRDLLPEALAPWRFVEAEARTCFEKYGYLEVRTPLFELADLFARGIGASTDIVEKEIYTFEKGKHLYALRPELTASIVRLYIEHSLDRTRKLRKFHYRGPLFRHERQQAHRYRQFDQVGVEVLGTKEPTADAETIALAVEFFGALGLADGLDLRLNNIGCNEPDCRPAYRALVRAELAPRLEGMCGNCQRRFDRNPFRILDCKEAGCREAIDTLPPVGERVCEACRGHFAFVEAALGDLGIRYRVDPTAVRGLDYYVRTVYEFACPALGGSQNALGGGGRYDGLLPLLGGPDVGGVGFALGVDRIVEAAAGRGLGGDGGPAPSVFVVAVRDCDRRAAFRLAQALRGSGVAASLDLEGRSPKAQMKEAHRVGARWVATVGAGGPVDGLVRLKDMETGGEEEVSWDALPHRLGQGR